MNIMIGITGEEFLHKLFAFILSAICLTCFSRILKKLLEKLLHTKKERFKEIALLNGKTSCSGKFSEEGSDALRHQASAASFNFAGFAGIKHIAGREIILF